MKKLIIPDMHPNIYRKQIRILLRTITLFDIDLCAITGKSNRCPFGLREPIKGATGSDTCMGCLYSSLFNIDV